MIEIKKTFFSTPFQPQKLELDLTVRESLMEFRARNGRYVTIKDSRKIFVGIRLRLAGVSFELDEYAGYAVFTRKRADDPWFSPSVMGARVRDVGSLYRVALTFPGAWPRLRELVLEVGGESLLQAFDSVVELDRQDHDPSRRSRGADAMQREG